MKKEIILDYVIGEIVKKYGDLTEEINNRKENYKDNYSIVFGRTFVDDIKVYFIYDLQHPRNLTQASIEDYVNDLLLEEF